MSLAECPNELQCLAARVVADSARVLEFADRLPPSYREEILQTVRSLTFDADRLRVLADSQADSLRDMFSKTSFMVDDLRASACIEGGWSKSLEIAIGHVGDLQKVIVGQFPGEEFPGGC